jgi:tetratricopeptide (TPR) repeat protein
MTDSSNSHSSLAEQRKELLGRAQISYLAGNYDESEKGFREVLRLAQDKKDPDPKIEVAARIGLAKIYHERASYELAVDALNVAIDMLKQISGGQKSRALVEALSDLGLAQMGMSDLESSEKTLKEGLQIAQRLDPSDELAIASAVNSLGRLYEQAENFEQAEPLLTKSLGTRRRLLPPLDLHIAESLTALASLHSAVGKLSLAELLLNEALTIQQKVLGKVHPRVAKTRQALVSLYWRLGKLTQAEKEWPEIIQLLEANLPKGHPQTIVAINEQANTELALGKSKEANEHFEKAAALVESNQALDDQIALATFVGMGVSQLRDGQYRKAEEYIRRALDKVGAAKKGTIHLEKSLLDNLISSLLLQGKFGDILKLVPDVVRAGQTQQVDQYSEMLDAIYRSLKKKK